MIINKILLIRKSTILNIQPVVENNMWEDEDFLQKTANQNFFDYPRVRLGQAGLVALAIVLPHSISFTLENMRVGNLGLGMLGFGVMVGAAYGMFGCINIVLDSHDWDNYIYKLEAKDCLRKLNRKKKLAVKQKKESLLEAEK